MVLVKYKNDFFAYRFTVRNSIVIMFANLYSVSDDGFPFTIALIVHFIIINYGIRKSVSTLYYYEYEIVYEICIQRGITSE